LLSNIKSLEERVLAIKNSDALPFSFFSDSFHKTQEISQLLHELELLQIEEMKHQMERLVLFYRKRKAEAVLFRKVQLPMNKASHPPQKKLPNKPSGTVMPKVSYCRNIKIPVLPKQGQCLKNPACYAADRPGIKTGCSFFER